MRVRVNRSAVLALLVRRNMTQKELAQRAGLGPGHLSRLLRGEMGPTPRVRRRLLDALAPIEFDAVFVLEQEPNGTTPGSTTGSTTPW